MQTTALLASFAVAFGRSAVPAASGALRPTRGAGASLMRLSGGASNEPSDALLQATYACNQLSAATLADAQGEVAALRKSVAGGEAVPTFGAKADELVADALDKFEAESPKGDADVTSLYATRAEELRGAIVGSLEPVFVQQICLLKDAAMEQFKKGLLGDGDGSEALAAAEAAFVREATASVPSKSGWGFKLERQSLVSAMQAILAEQKKAQSAKLQTAQQMQTALSYLQACNTLLPAPLRFFCPPHSRSLLVPAPTRRHLPLAHDRLVARRPLAPSADAAAADAGPAGAVHRRPGWQVEPRRRIPPAGHQHQPVGGIPAGPVQPAGLDGARRGRQPARPQRLHQRCRPGQPRPLLPGPRLRRRYLRTSKGAAGPHLRVRSCCPSSGPHLRTRADDNSGGRDGRCA